jgi:hypothetical protein
MLGPHADTSRNPATATAAAGSSARWQSVADVPQRLACAKAVMALIRDRCGPHVAQRSSMATLAAVRAVEVHLYRNAPSMQVKVAWLLKRFRHWLHTCPCVCALLCALLPFGLLCDPNAMVPCSHPFLQAYEDRATLSTRVVAYVRARAAAIAAARVRGGGSGVDASQAASIEQEVEQPMMCRDE